MRIVKLLSVAAVGFTIAVGGSSIALAKAHDQGVADGTQPIPPGFASHLNNNGNGSIVSGLSTPGIGSKVKNPDTCPTSPFPTCGVAAAGEDTTYGQAVTSPIRGDIRVVPVGAPGQPK